MDGHAHGDGSSPWCCLDVGIRDVAVQHCPSQAGPSSRMKNILWSDIELCNMYYPTFLSSELNFYLPRR